MNLQALCSSLALAHPLTLCIVVLWVRAPPRVIALSTYKNRMVTHASCVIHACSSSSRGTGHIAKLTHSLSLSLCSRLVGRGPRRGKYGGKCRKERGWDKLFKKKNSWGGR
ncbi:hypothetical protein O6H91_12G056100 [Diphasiastrum complanatum]|uniref:Uncharacterized protein n=1 Tax=Diphasiastrum complanatum TaxID=34168 RepID=A0ACC2C373_DIPCM|nr:hypothetical protein O6H91_12G056100 [Diphasiastrum complanatum]